MIITIVLIDTCKNLTDLTFRRYKQAKILLITAFKESLENSLSAANEFFKRKLVSTCLKWSPADRLSVGSQVAEASEENVTNIVNTVAYDSLSEKKKKLFELFSVSARRLISLNRETSIVQSAAKQKFRFI